MGPGKIIVALFVSVALVVALFFASVGHQIDRTVLRADFVADQLEQVDAIGLATGVMIANLEGEAKHLWPPMEKSINENRPWIKTELRRILRLGFAYFRGEADRVQFEISLKSVRDNFQQHLHHYLQENPPTEIAALAPPDKAKAVADLETAFMANLGLPDVFAFNSDIAAADYRQDLSDIRQIFGYSRALYFGSVVVAGLLALALVWLASLRWLGVVVAIFGFAVYVPALLLKGEWVARIIDEVLELPDSVTVHLPLFYRNAMQPLTATALTFLLGGVLLVAASFFLPQKNSADRTGLTPVRH